VSGAEHWDPATGRVVFPKPSGAEIQASKKDRSYHTLGGPCASSIGQVYSNTTENLADGVMRLTKSRLPLLVGAEKVLQDNQKAFIAKNQDFVAKLRGEYTRHFMDCQCAIDEAYLHHDDPHPKRALRFQSWNEVIGSGVMYDDVWNLPGKYAKYKVKIFEVAKPSKTIRCIGDLGCPSSLQGFRLASFMKDAMNAEPILISGGEIEYCKEPSAQSLCSTFEKLINPPGRFYFVYFSDDSCLSVRTEDGKVLRFNADISSCDASHTEALFEAYVQLHPARLQEDVQKLVAQCRQPITIVDIYNSKRKIRLRPKTPRLYSGSTITTSLNNFACQIIGLSIAQTRITCAEDVIGAARAAGYIITCDDCADWHQLQFLKHSPVYDTTSRIRALLNLGVLLKISGRAKGDYLGTKTESMRERVERQQRGLLQGAYPRAHFTLIDNMKRSCALQPGGTDGSIKLQLAVAAATRSVLDYKVSHTDADEHFTVPTGEVYQRYQLNPYQIQQIDGDFGNSGYGDHYASDATTAILAKDYGLAAAYLDGPPLDRPPPHWT
jgi:hypothetical protein